MHFSKDHQYVSEPNLTNKNRIDKHIDIPSRLEPSHELYKLLACRYSFSKASNLGFEKESLFKEIDFL